MSDRKNTDTRYLTKDEAIKYIKNKYRRGVSYFVSAGTFTYTKTPEEVADGENPQGYEQICFVNVSQRQAIKYVEDCIRRVFEDRGVKIGIRDSGVTCHEDGSVKYGGCIFIG